MATKCANCSEDALYIYAPNPAFPTYYCPTDLPGFLKDQKDAGHLQRLVPEPEIEEVLEPAPKASKKKAAAVEEPVVEEAPAE
jgi:hypothetical protein